MALSLSLYPTAQHSHSVKTEPSPGLQRGKRCKYSQSKAPKPGRAGKALQWGDLGSFVTAPEGPAAGAEEIVKSFHMADTWADQIPEGWVCQGKKSRPSCSHWGPSPPRALPQGAPVLEVPHSLPGAGAGLAAGKAMLFPWLLTSPDLIKKLTWTSQITLVNSVTTVSSRT